MLASQGFSVRTPDVSARNSSVKRWKDWYMGGTASLGGGGRWSQARNTNGAGQAAPEADGVTCSRAPIHRPPDEHHGRHPLCACYRPSVNVHMDILALLLCAHRTHSPSSSGCSPSTSIGTSYMYTLSEG